jgi:CelD/BcsL family acetyltransferase involved in cellulose biosynthesis
MYAQIIKGAIIFEELAKEWDSLAQRGMTDTPFQTLAYQESWWRNLHPEGSELNSIVARSDDHRLTAIACMYVTADGVVRFNGCVEETDYLDLITEARHAKEAWELIFGCLLSREFPEWRLLELCNVPSISPSRNILSSLSEATGHCLVESVNEVCPVINLPDSYDAYLQMLDSKQRREIRRKLRRAEAAGAEIHLVGAEDDIEEAVDEFLALLQKSTFEKRDWLNKGRRALFLEVASAAQKAGTLQLFFIKIGEQNAAALFNFDYADRIWVYNSGLDPEAFGNLSLGVVLTAKAIEWAIAENRTEFDFLRGSETYKYRFGASDTNIYRMQISRS